MSCVTGINSYYHEYVSLLLLQRYIFISNNHKLPVAILSILSCRHDPTWVLSHIWTAVALGSYYLAFQGRLGTFPSPLLSDEVGPYGGFQSC